MRLREKHRRKSDMHDFPEEDNRRDSRTLPSDKEAGTELVMESRKRRISCALAEHDFRER
ncbi:hypothetical protein BALCAV_0205395 [Alkalihalobacillus alcalophilus ATCC 27647 = CGMCC 1.3604]|uniref:Uncharacterized protein n=1 Tax=Alkalihalobacillus alcalophilus ATCC 27647 = CGMCC 1.3604 TaxID=1218173 RepID=A0A094WKT3_ALKAL|nr:hypothetical protein BALCAV_0205395 [Alkalihalobacillus alcalophilus ATCC 27647 = CGMCC 1.3604]